MQGWQSVWFKYFDEIKRISKQCDCLDLLLYQGITDWKVQSIISWL